MVLGIAQDIDFGIPHKTSFDGNVVWASLCIPASVSSTSCNTSLRAACRTIACKQTVEHFALVLEVSYDSASHLCSSDT